MNYRKILALGISASLIFQACAPATINVTPLSAEQAKKIEQNLKNRILPNPSDVKNGTVAAVDDACQKFKETIPKDWTQDLIEVPEDPAKPEGQKIHVFYYGKIKADRTPVVFFNGGPASSSHGSFRSISQEKWRLDPNEDVSMIYIDQRGTGCSDYYPQVKDRQNPDPEILARLRLYGARGIVADAEAVRSKLIGDKPWIAFGQSYGAAVVHRYIDLAPKSLKAGFAHANTIDSDGYQRIKNRIASQVRVMKQFTDEYPDDLFALDVLKKKLIPQFCRKNASGTKEVCGPKILEIIPSKLLGFSDDRTTLHEWIQIMVQNGDVRPEGVDLFLKTFYFNETNPLNSTDLAFQVITWVERNQPSLDGLHCKKIADDLKKEQNIDLNQAITECSVSLAYELNSLTDSQAMFAKLEKDTLTLDQFQEALKTYFDLPFYWYSGNKDSYVPVESFKEEIDRITTLPNVHYLNFTSTGHDGFLTEPKVWLDLISEVKPAQAALAPLVVSPVTAASIHP